ncbi:MAG: family 10 glycosylhydrolase, partial [Acidobacteria bacterium]|nr:family 10 glycosylhydrolase [Acidobacteriota bacterium]
MFSSVRRSGWRLAAPACALAAAVVLLGGPLTLRGQGRSDEVRALWVARTSLASPSSISAMIQSAKVNRFNTLLVQVRARGDAYFNDGVEPRATSLAGQPDTFDPLQSTLAEAHAAGLRVHAWINVALVASAVDLPASRSHVIYGHPEWLMVPRAIAEEMALLDPRSQLYVDKLARWVRSQNTEVEGLYLSPIPRAAADYTVAVVSDLVARYPVDGVHLDYARYPTDDFDYSREALAAFGADEAASLPASETRRLQQRVRSDSFAFTDAAPDRWRAFRRDRFTALVRRLKDAVRLWRPDALVTAAVYPDAADAATRRLQDWRVWLNNGSVDVVCPMAYATDAPTFTAQMTSARAGAGDRPLWAGIGAYRLTSSQTIENIQIARRLGADGIVL